MSEARYTVEFLRHVPAGSGRRYIKTVVWNAEGKPSLIPLPLAHKIARQMAAAVGLGARVLDGEREIARYLYRDGEVVEETLR